jgi:hypothetical protein
MIPRIRWVWSRAALPAALLATACSGSDLVLPDQTEPAHIEAIAGTNQAGGGTQFRILRYNSNGSNDTSFSGDGLVDQQFNGSNPTAANALALGPGNTFIVAGYCQVSKGNQDFAVARYFFA